MGTIGLQYHKAIGVNRATLKFVHMPSEQTLVFFSGCNVIQHNVETGDQRFLPYTDHERGEIECIAVSPDGRLIAFGLHSDAVICMIDVHVWQRKPVLSLPSGHLPTTFVALAFSPGAKFLVAQGAGNEPLFLFEVKSGALVHAQKIVQAGAGQTSVSCVTFNPNEQTQMCCTGRGVFRQISKTDKGFTVKQTSMANKDALDFKSHIFTNDGRSIITALGDGRLCQIDQSGVRVDLPLANPSGTPVQCLATTPKGFVCVVGGNRLHFFERSGEKSYAEAHSVLVDERETVVALSLAPGEDRVAVLLSDGRIQVVPVAGDAAAEGMQVLLQPSHTGAVLSIDVAYRKQLVVSCGEDHTIRVWNFDKMQCEVSKVFSEAPLFVSIHPSGSPIAAVFAEKVRVLAVTVNDIVTHKELPIRNAKEVRFSRGGQFFAVVALNSVQLYSSHTFHGLCSLRSPGSRVKAIAWSQDDSVLVSCDANGSVTLFNVRTGKQRATGPQQPFHVTSIVAADAVGSKCFGVTLPDNQLRVLDDCATRDQIELAGTPTHVLLGPAERCAVVSTSQGTVLLYPFATSGAASGLPNPDSVAKYACHRGEINAIALSPDQTQLFTAGADGSIFVLNFTGVDTSRSTQVRYSDDVLVPRGEIVEQLRALRRAQQDVADVDAEQKMKLASLAQGFEQKRREISEKSAEEKAAERANVAELVKQIAALNEDAAAQRATLEAQYQQDMQQKRTRLELNLQSEKESEEQLVREKEEMAKRMETELSRVLDENAAEADRTSQRFEAELRGLEARRQDVAEGRRKDKADFADWEVGQGRTLAFEIGLREHEAEKARRVAVEQNAVLTERLAVATAEYEQVRAKVESGQGTLEKVQGGVRRTQELIQAAKHRKEQLATELSERKESIAEKEIKIEELRAKNLTLDKHKQLVRDRIADRKRELEPKLAREQDLTVTTQRMQQELGRYAKNDEQLALELAELKLKIDSKKAEIEERGRELDEVRQLTRQFKLEVHRVRRCLKAERSGRDTFAPALAALYRKYVGDEGAAALRSKVTDIQVERNRERDALERNITAVARRIARGSEEYDRQRSRMQDEGVVLMGQINELRRENSLLQARRAVLEESAKAMYTADELDKILGMQADRIAQLVDQLRQLRLRGAAATRGGPMSRERLPPMAEAS